ncbi:dehydrogenase [Dermatophagoides pteronyssinus]|uniref:Dehydrogenase n=1 Tax=Dermatophagoides pteronyssinus TaxID=6956 RepID=A0ABQ8JHY5_DERPT|nr:dehydrogenase [Dermatophagoides pteronyssinus]
MQKAGKILIKNLKTLVTGSSSRLGNKLVQELIENGGTVYAVDKRIHSLQLYGKDHHFVQGDLADQTFLDDYLKNIGPIDALVNCAGHRSSYNYFLSYLISKNILEKLQSNEINKFGCRGCIINLVYINSQYDAEYFKKQDDFVKKYGIQLDTIDDDVFRLADLLTAARIRCNTLMVDSKLDEKQFSSMVMHILEDQYIAGQVINMEDNLRHHELNYDEFKAEILRGKVKEQKGDQNYFLPSEIKEEKIIPLSDSTLPIKS